MVFVATAAEETNFLAYSELLVGLISGTDEIKAVEGSVNVKNVLAVLTVIADQCPSIAKRLLEALQLVTEREERVDDVRSFQVSNECLTAIVPSFCKGGRRIGLRFFDLVECFVGNYSKIASAHRKNFFLTFMNVVVRVKKNGDGVAAVVGSLLAGFGSKSEKESEEMRKFCMTLVINMPTSEQVRRFCV